MVKTLEQNVFVSASFMDHLDLNFVPKKCTLSYKSATYALDVKSLKKATILPGGVSKIKL